MKNKESKTGSEVKPESKGEEKGMQHGKHDSRVSKAKVIVDGKLVPTEIILFPRIKLSSGIECSPISESAFPSTHNFLVEHGEVGHLENESLSSFKSRTRK